MIGLETRVKNVPNNYLYQIFSGIDLTKYIWEINEDYIMCCDGDVHRETLFDKDGIDGEEFLKCISRDGYYMLFADIKAFLMDGTRMAIKTYEDFLESDCQMIILCTDVTFIDFYCKDAAILEKVYKNCIDNNFEEVKIVTPENNFRTRMSVW